MGLVPSPNFQTGMFEYQQNSDWLTEAEVSFH